MRPALAHGLAVALAVALAACGPSGSDGSAGKPAPGPAPPARPEPAPPPAAPPAPAAPSARPAPPAADGSASGSFPEACDEYRGTIERLSRCVDALAPQTRDSLRALFERQWAGWAKLPEQDRRALAAICKRSSDTVQEAAAAACGW